MNERYGKYTAPSGKTRKSAASAKPKRAGATGAVSAKKKPASAASKRRSAIVQPQTPEYKRWRTVWWALLGGAIVFSTLAWWLWENASNRDLGSGILVAGYAMIFGAVIIDFVKLRPLRQDWMRTHELDGTPKKAEKAEKAETKPADTSDATSTKS